MNKLLGLGALAVGLAGVLAPEASASGINFRFGAGIGFSFEGGGWGGGQGHGGHGHRQQYMYIFPEPYQLYGGGHYGDGHYGGEQHHDALPQADQPYQPFPPPPARDKKTQPDTLYRQYNAPRYQYPNLGYSIYPTAGHPHHQPPALRFDQ
jgi:hypothetical protein